MLRLISVLLSVSALSTGVYAGDKHTHWGYQGDTGPGNWANLNSDFATCASGSRQSPIDIKTSQRLAANLGNIEFDYDRSSQEVLNNGHTIQVNTKPGNHIKVGGNDYELLQFHFHSPSENTIDGKSYPMEMHLVHKNENGELAVVGVLFEDGANNKVVEQIWRRMPKQAGTKNKLTDLSIKTRQLLPASGRYAHFKGSLTTPPCSEGVNWFVMTEPLAMSREQISQFKQLLGENARPVQALNNRFVLANK